jgi:hypothetical protein
MTVSANDITRRGNAVGFDAAGNTITGEYRGTVKAWTIRVVRNLGYFSEVSSQTFVDKAEAAAYASTLVDDVMTADMRWW